MSKGGIEIWNQKIKTSILEPWLVVGLRGNSDGTRVPSKGEFLRFLSMLIFFAYLFMPMLCFHAYLSVSGSICLSSSKRGKLLGTELSGTQFL